MCPEQGLLTRPHGRLQLLSMPRHHWSDISLDFVMGLPPSEGNTTVLRVVDRFSKMVHFIPLIKLPSAKETVEAVLSHGFCLHGFPKDVVSDWGLSPSQSFRRLSVPSSVLPSASFPGTWLSFIIVASSGMGPVRCSFEARLITRRWLTVGELPLPCTKQGRKCGCLLKIFPCMWCLASWLPGLWVPSLSPTQWLCDSDSPDP